MVNGKVPAHEKVRALRLAPARQPDDARQEKGSEPA
jgi:hypothetical protein